MGTTRLTITICILLVTGANGSTGTKIDEEIVNAMNGFGINLYLDLSSEKANIFCSPLSVTALLNQLLTGASDDVGAEIRDVLGYTRLELSTQEARIAFNRFLSKLEGNRSGFVFGNSLWIQTGLKRRAEFGSNIELEEREVDFRNSVIASDQIGNWTRKLTNKPILKFSSSEIDATLKRLFLSVVDFSGSTWQYQFLTSKTKREPFYINGGRKVVYVPMMLISGYFKYSRSIDLNAELIEFPYADKDIAMVIILPKEIDGIASQREHLSLDTITQSIHGMGECQVHLRIPRFDVQSSLSLKRTLNTFGMVNSFAPGNDSLDFSISDVLHKTVISVSEKGSLPDPLVVISNGMASHDYDQPCMTYYTVDHPFTFLIRHKPTGGILFIGQVVKP